MIVDVSAGDVALLMVHMSNNSGDMKKLIVIMLKIENEFVAFERCHFFMNLKPEPGYNNIELMHRDYDAILNSRNGQIENRQYRAD